MNIDDIANAMNNQSGNKPKNTKPKQAAKPTQQSSDPLSGLVNAMNQQGDQGTAKPAASKPATPKPAAPKPAATSNQATGTNPFNATYDDGGSTSSSGGQSMDMGGMGGLLGALLGGAGASQQPASYDTGSGGQADMGSLLGSLLGGAGASQQPANYDTGSGGGGLGSLLGALLGGGSQSNSSMGLLGGLLGGGNTGSPFDALALPLAKKLGIPPQLASIIVMLVANALLGKNKNRAGEVDVNRAELSDVMALYNSGEFNSSAVQNNQLVQEISQQTGLDHATAARSIGDLLEIMNSQANAQ